MGWQGNHEHCLLRTNVVMPLGLMVPGPGVEPRSGGKSSAGDSSPVDQGRKNSQPLWSGSGSQDGKRLWEWNSSSGARL